MRPVFAVASLRPSLYVLLLSVPPAVVLQGPWARPMHACPVSHISCVALQKSDPEAWCKKKKTTDESYSDCPLFLEMFLTQTEFFVYSPLTVASVLSLKIYRR
jgi:hypothetical protein